jgi:LysR family nitrogen assimilation transcriptional regulator
LEAKTTISDASSEPAGPLSCAMPPSISAVIGAPLVKTFLDRFPNVMLHLIDAFSGYVNELLVEGRVDVAIVIGARRSPQIRADPLLEVDLFYVTTRNRVPARRQSETTVSFQEVADGKLILPGRHHGLRRELEAAATEQGLKLDVFVEIDALSAMKELVRGDVGPTVLPQGAILAEFNDPQLIIRRIVDPPLTHQFMIAYARYRPPTLATTALGKALKEEIRLAIADGRLIGRS